ncbi:MAG: hypothetical protein LBH73_06515 [Spirochaetaceae bacterium]|jgi:hypothetical protein|nr:hypothetical protein [Spirochaetaceae bacterium]
MTLFSFAWVFVFYLFWRAVVGGGGSGGVWALVFGLIIALFQRFAGPLVYPGGFGFLRWVSSFVDLIVFPVLLPLGICFIFMLFNTFSGSLNITNFLLICLIPCSLFRALNLESYPSALEAVFVPLLWTALAVGIPFFVQELYGSVPAAGAGVLLPFLGVTSYWAFFGQRFFLGYALAALSLLPMFSTMTIHFIKMEKRG